LKFQEDISKHTKYELFYLVLMLSTIKGLLQFLVEKPTAYLDEMEEFLLDEYGAVVSQATIYRTLERAKWSRKVASKHAKERSEALRGVF
jgi:transposase